MQDMHVLSRDEAAFIAVQVVKRRDQPLAATWRFIGSDNWSSKSLSEIGMTLLSYL